jgi:hypothetical protein
MALSLFLVNVDTIAELNTMQIAFFMLLIFPSVSLNRSERVFKIKCVSGVPWLTITGSGLDDWIYRHYCTLVITIGYNRNSSQSTTDLVLIHRITGVLDFFHRPVFLGVETRRFGNWICFRPQVKGEEDAKLGTLERANFNHRTWFGDSVPKNTGRWKMSKTQ